ncbi:NADH-quinone oxidoreductase subunit N [Candidatus Trichorickettsia mobilis]|uniref:NADH-quinone oxidoreductase subunit N n=1 Tax=Candidatus Trichorickettsia mobilis TaxID=1346319 RepID=UPI00292CA96A|nr:NADH-quinone oxidoreductase subunit N [Candidatus Trichorickettsia mobilis]
MIIMPEFILTVLALLAQLAAVFCRERVNLIVKITIMVLMFLMLVLVLLLGSHGMGCNGSFVSNFGTSFYKLLVLGFTIMSIVIYYEFCKISAVNIRMEYITLLLFSTVGVFLSISSRNLLLLFCGLELTALAGYALAGFNLDIKSAEAAVKYFVLGALLSCITLLGMSFLYGFAGSLDFKVIFEMFNNAAQLPNIGIIIGAVLMLSGLLFKFSAAPLHMWTPDVYEGSSVTTVTYFVTAQKIGVLFVLLNILTLMIGEYPQITVSLIKIVAIFSMVIGSLGAIMQKSIKRLMAYSTILNVGYVLMGISLSLHNVAGILSAIVYMVIYIIAALGFFACLIALLGKNAEEATFDDISGIATNRKAIAAAIAVMMFSMIGLPPLAGFFGKYYIFYQAIKQQEIMLAVIGMMSSIIASYYYLKIVRSMYFADNIKQIEIIPTSNGLLFITCLVVTFLLLFSLFAANYLELLTA